MVEKTVEQTRSQELSRTWFKQASIQEMSELFDSLATQLQQENPTMSSYDFCQSLVGKLPQRFPFEAQRVIVQAIANLDSNTRQFGRKALIFVTINTALTVTDYYFRKGDDPKEKEELIKSALIAIGERLTKPNPKITLSQQAHKAAREGIAEYICVRDNVPIELARYYRYPEIAEIINEALKDQSTVLSQGEIIELAEYIEQTTGFSPQILIPFISYKTRLTPLIEEHGEQVTGEDETLKEALRNDLKEKMADVLHTLRNKQERVIQNRYGLEGSMFQTLKEVGMLLGTSRENIRQIESKALRMLRHPSRSVLLKDFLGLDGGTLENIGKVEPEDTARVARHVPVTSSSPLYEPKQSLIPAAEGSRVKAPTVKIPTIEDIARRIDEATFLKYTGYDNEVRLGNWPSNFYAVRRIAETYLKENPDAIDLLLSDEKDALKLFDPSDRRSSKMYYSKWVAAHQHIFTIAYQELELIYRRRQTQQG